MKNNTVKKINFSIVTDELLVHACTLDSNQAGVGQILDATPGSLYVLQDPSNAPLDNVLVAKDGLK